MLDLLILGFLAERPHHGYDLRRRIRELSGFARHVSDGSLYPAINRLVAAGCIERREDEGSPRERHRLSLTETGRDRLLGLLRDADGVDVTDLSRFMVVLAFLGLLPDPADRAAVLRRRLDFLDVPASFFYVDGRPVRQREIACPYRQGMITIARATRAAERTWLREMVGTA